MSVMDSLKGVLPDWDLASVGNFLFIGLIWFLIIVIVAGGLSLWAWWYISKKKFSKKIVIWKKVGGVPKVTHYDTAMERKMGQGGDTIFYIKKLKRIIPRPSIQSGENTYHFAERSDGELENIGMEDFDLKFKEMKVQYTPNEMRYAKESLRDLIKDRYNKETFWQKYGTMIMSIVYIVLITVLLLLIAGKLMQLTGTLGSLIDNVSKLMEESKNILSSVDNICS